MADQAINITTGRPWSGEDFMETDAQEAARLMREETERLAAQTKPKVWALAKAKAVTAQQVRALAKAERPMMSDAKQDAYYSPREPLTKARPPRSREDMAEDYDMPQPWQKPIPLDAPVPAFPVETLGHLAGPVAELATELQTPVDLIAMSTLAAISAAVSGRIGINVRAGWREPLNLYLAVVMAPGETKSPALSRVAAALHLIEANLIESSADRVSVSRAERRIAEARLRHAEATYVKARPEARNEAKAEAEAARAGVDNLVDVYSPRLLVGDVTPEGLVKLMAEQGGAIASLSAEGGLFENFVSGRYNSGSANLEAILQAHDGREPIMVDRKGSDPIRVERPCLTLGLAVQPHVLESVGASREAMERGLMARFLYSVPASLVGRRAVEAPVSSGADQLIGNSVSSVFYATRREQRGSECFEDNSLISDLELSSSSLKIHQDYRRELETRRHPTTGDLAQMVGWSNKLDGQLARIAGLLHLIDLSKEPVLKTLRTLVGDSPMQRACVLVGYLIEHARAAHNLMRDGTTSLAGERELLTWLRAEGEHEMSVRTAHQRLRGRSRFREVQVIKEAFAGLEANGWVRLVPPVVAVVGRPSSARYELHPDLFR
jgi:replicative DNA helicase